VRLTNAQFLNQKTNVMYQILVNGNQLRPTIGNPYIFKNYKAAYDMAVLCYGIDRINKSILINKI
jgi:hypothetical protein